MQGHAERADNNSRESAKELSALGTANTEAVVVDLCLHAWVAMHGLLCMWLSTQSELEAVREARVNILW